MHLTRDGLNQAEALAAKQAGEFRHKIGALAGGHDIEKGTYTVQQTIARAAQLPQCKGFTFCASAANPGTVVECYFKSSSEGNNDPNWQTYERHHGHHGGGRGGHHGGGHKAHHGGGHGAHHGGGGHGHPDQSFKTVNDPICGVPAVLTGNTGHNIQCIAEQHGKAHCTNHNRGEYESLVLKKVDASHVIITSNRNGQNLHCRRDGSVAFCTTHEVLYPFCELARL